MKKIFYMLVIVTLNLGNSTKGQVVISDITDYSQIRGKINQEAALQFIVKNKDKGVIFPIVNLVDVKNPSPLKEHNLGAIVYNNGLNLEKGLYYNDGSKWGILKATKPQVRPESQNYTIGDIKYSPENQDHFGWYLLDGRAISSLDSEASKSFNSLGLNLQNLPNARGAYLKGKSNDNEKLGTVITNEIKLTQNNLPNTPIQPGIQTEIKGNHKHTGSNGFVIKKDNNSIGKLRLQTNTGAIWAMSGIERDIDNDSEIVAGEHTHNYEFALGGKEEPFYNKPNSIATNMFIYLGY